MEFKSADATTEVDFLQVLSKVSWACIRDALDDERLEER